MLCPTSGTAVAVLEAAGCDVGALSDRLWAAVGDDELVDGIQALETLLARAGAVRARMLAELDHREVPRRQLSWTSTHEWYAHLAGTTVGEARRTVVHARALTTEREETMTALEAGEISAAQAGIVCDAVEQLPTSPTLREQGERVLLEQAARLNATELRKAARHLVEVVDPDRCERRAEADLAREERAAHLGRHLSITDDGAGGVRVRGRGSTEDAAVIRAALLPLTRPEPAVDPVDPGAPVDPGDPGDPGGPVDPADSSSPHRDPRDHGTRMWDALVEVAQHSLDTDRQPSTHGARPRVGVLIDLERLRHDQEQATGTATAVTEDGLTLSAAATRRLACDADVLPVCLGGEGQVLDVGRAHRLVTAALWLALLARDRHCAFPGCHRPPVMCHGHHVRHWADGGPTSLDNLVMLCGAHHRVIHHTPWQVRLSPVDGRPEFRPPPRRHGDPPPDQWIRERPRHE